MAEFLKAVVQDFLGDQGKVMPDTSFQSLMNLTAVTDVEEPILPELPTFGPDDPLGNWLVWGDALRRDHNIEQYAFVAWDDG